MSTNIEQRVISLKFNKEEFEEHAKDTIRTLEKLDSSIDEFGNKKRSESGITALVTTVTKASNAFKMLGKIGEGALQKIGWSGIDLVSKKMSSLFKEATGMNNMIAGWNKYGQEIESVQTIMNATGKTMDEVQTSLDKIAWFTDETSYEYDSMVANIGRFNAAGVSLEDAEQTMLGIASAAGYFGVNASKATHAMSGFANAIGKGKMDRAAWQWIETAGMNVEGLQTAFMETAAEMGVLVKTGTKAYKTLDGNAYAASEFKNSLTEGWLTTEVMTKTLNKYSKSIDTIYDKYKEFGGEKLTSDIIDEFGDQLDQTSVKAFRAAQEAKTFKDAWDSVTVAIQSKWRESFRLVIGNYEQAKKLWTAVANELYEVFAASSDLRNELLRKWNERGGRDSLIQAFANIWVGIKNIVEPIKEVFDKIFPATTVDRLLEITRSFENLTKKFRDLFEVKSEETQETLENLATTAEKVITPFTRTKEVLDELAQQVIRGDWGNGQQRFDSLEQAGYYWQMVQNRVNELVGDSWRYTIVEDEVVEVTQEATKAVIEQEEALDEIALGGMRVYQKGAKKTTESNEELRKSLEATKRVEKLQNIFGGLFAAFDMGRRIIKEVVSRFGELITKVVEKSNIKKAIDWVIDGLSIMGEKILKVWENFDESKLVSEAFDAIATNVDSLAENIGKLFKTIGELGHTWLPRLRIWIEQAFNAVYPAVSQFFTMVWGWIKTHVPNILNGVKTFWDSFWNKIKSSEGPKRLLESIKTVFGALGQFGLKGFDELRKLIGGLFGDSENIDAGEAFADLIDFISGKLSDILESLSTAGDAVKNFFGMFKNNETNDLVEFSTNIGDAATNISRSMDTNLSPMADFFSGMMGIIEKFLNVYRNPMGALTDKLNEMGEKLAGLLSGVTVEGTFDAVKKAGIGTILFFVAQQIGKAVKGLTGIPSGIVSVLSSIRDVFITYQSKLNSTMLLDIAKAFGILTFSLVALSLIDADALLSAASALVSVGFALYFVLQAYAKVKEWSTHSLEQKNVGAALENAKEEQKQNVGLLQGLINGFTAPIKDFQTALNASIDKRLNGRNLSKSFLSVAAALAILLNFVIKPLSELDLSGPDGQKILQGALLAGGIMAAFGIMIGIANKMGGKVSFGSAASYITFALSMLILTKALMGFKDYTPQQMMNVQDMLLTFGGMMVALGITMALIGKYASKTTSDVEYGKLVSKTGPQIGQFALLILSIAGAFLLMTPAFKIIGSMTADELKKVAAVVAGFTVLVAIMSAVAWAMSSVPNALASVAGLNTIVNAIVKLSVVMAIVGTLAKAAGGWEVIGYGLAAMAGALTVLFGAVAVLSITGMIGAFERFAVGIEKISNGALKFAAGLTLGAVALWAFGKALPSLVDGIVYLGTALTNEETRGKFIAGLLALIGAVLVVLVAAKADIIGVLAGYVTAAFGWLNTALPGILSHVTGALGTILDALGKWLGSGHTVTKIIFLVSTILGILGALVPTIVDWLMNFIIKVLYALGDAVREHGPELGRALWYLIRQIFGTLTDGVGAIGEGLSSLWDETIGKGLNWIGESTGWWNQQDLSKNDGNIQKWFSGIADWIKGDAHKAAEDIEQAGDEVAGSINAAGETVNDATSNFASVNPTGSTENSIIGSFKNMSSAWQEGASQLNLDVQNYGAGIEGFPFDIQTVMGDANVNLDEGLYNLESTWESHSLDTWGYGDAGIENYTEGMLSGEEQLTTTTEEILERHRTGFATSVENDTTSTDAGKLFVEKYAKGMSDEAGSETTASRVTLAMSKINSNVVTLDNINKAHDSGKTLGKYVPEGYAAGIMSNTGLAAITTAIHAMVNHGAAETAIAQDSKSPSKLFAIFGGYAAQGYAVGMQENAYLAGDAAHVMVNSSMEAVRDAISLASDAFGEDWENGPIITPVLDLSNVKAGVGNLNRLTNGTSMNIAGSIGEIHTPKQTFLNKLASLEQGMSSINSGLVTAGDASLTVNVPLYLDSKEVGHATAPIVSADIDRMQRNAMRRSGKR